MPCAAVAAIYIFVTTELSSQLSNGTWCVCGFVGTGVSRPAIAVNHGGPNPCMTDRQQARLLNT